MSIQINYTEIITVLIFYFIAQKSFFNVNPVHITNVIYINIFLALLVTFSWILYKFARDPLIIRVSESTNAGQSKSKVSLDISEEKNQSSNVSTIHITRGYKFQSLPV